jgi:hypothetical protein
MNSKGFYYLHNPLSLSNERVIKCFPPIAFNSIIASNKQRQDHNNLATIQRGKIKRAHERSKSIQFVEPRIQMPTLTGIDKIGIEDITICQ